MRVYYITDKTYEFKIKDSILDFTSKVCIISYKKTVHQRIKLPPIEQKDLKPAIENNIENKNFVYNIFKATKNFLIVDVWTYERLELECDYILVEDLCFLSEEPTINLYPDYENPNVIRVVASYGRVFAGSGVFKTKDDFKKGFDIFLKSVSQGGINYKTLNLYGHYDLSEFIKSQGFNVYTYHLEYPAFLHNPKNLKIPQYKVKKEIKIDYRGLVYASMIVLFFYGVATFLTYRNYQSQIEKLKEKIETLDKNIKTLSLQISDKGENIEKFINIVNDINKDMDATQLLNNITANLPEQDYVLLYSYENNTATLTVVSKEPTKTLKKLADIKFLDIRLKSPPTKNQENSFNMVLEVEVKND